MSAEYDAFELEFPVHRNPHFRQWRQRLGALPSSEVLIRDAAATGQDGRRVSDLQVVCSPITVKSVRDNVSMIAKQVVLLAEIDEVHVGFCISLPGPKSSDPLFIQIIGVAPEAQRRGAGLALLAAATERTPSRDIALATQDSNTGALALNERFASSIGASIGRVPLSTYRDRDLGIGRGQGYRAWVLRRRPVKLTTNGTDLEAVCRTRRDD